MALFCGLLHERSDPMRSNLASRSMGRLLAFLAGGWGTLALTAAVLPYVSRIGEFLPLRFTGTTLWRSFTGANGRVAGLVVPAAIRAA